MQKKLAFTWFVHGSMQPSLTRYPRYRSNYFHLNLRGLIVIKNKMEIEYSDSNPYRSYRKPRKLAKIKSSPFETTEALHTNKRYWDSVFHDIDTTATDIVS